MPTTPFRQVQRRFYDHLADCVKKDDNGRIHSDRLINPQVGRLLRVPMYGYIAVCAVCRTSRLIMAGWLLVDRAQVGYTCSECDHWVRDQSAVETTRWA